MKWKWKSRSSRCSRALALQRGDASVGHAVVAELAAMCRHATFTFSVLLEPQPV